MQSPGREPSMEDILASIKKVIAEEKELRTTPRRPSRTSRLPRDESNRGRRRARAQRAAGSACGPRPAAGGREAAGQSRQALEQLQTVAANVPAAPAVNPLEEMVREMLRPMLKQWLDEHLPQMVDEHVKREISRITGGRSSPCQLRPRLCYACAHDRDQARSLAAAAAALAASPARRPSDDRGRPSVDASSRLAGRFAGRAPCGVHRLQHRLGQEQAREHALSCST